MATTLCPALPAELWLRVLQNLQKEEDLPELWTSLRYVCTTFKGAVEAIIRENHLRKTWISFQLGDSWDEDERIKIPFDSEFEFSHLSEDKTQATFKTLEFDAKHKPELRKRLRQAVEGRIIEAPQYEVQIHRDVNDGPIPSLSLDYENLQLTCDWREMFSNFYGEEQIYHKLLSKWVKDQEQWSVGLREKMKRGELDMGKMIEQAVGGFASGSEDARKMARRARIGREFQRLDGIKWDAELDGDLKQEEEALRHLKNSRFLISFETHSDDEDEEDEDASEEDDEWEDEDEDESDADSE